MQDPQFILDLSQASESLHKSIWPPTGSEIAGYFIMFFMSALANAAGIGGGTVMIPAFVVLFYFETHTAVPLAQVMIFVGAMGAVALKLQNRHPTRDRPLIFYKFIMLVQSPLLLGATVGAIINTILPAWLIELMLALTLATMCYSTTKKGITLFKKETKENSNERLLPQEYEMKSTVHADTSSSSEGAQEVIEDEKLRAILNEEKKIVPLKEVCVIFGIWVTVVIFTFMRGGTVPSIVGIQKCSSEYFGLIAAFVCILTLIFLYNLNYVIQDTELKESLNYNWDVSDLKWTKKAALTFALITIGIGFLSGMIGLAGGFMLIPLMLAYGVRPEQATATSSSMVVFTSSTTILQFIVANKLHPEYAVAVFCISLLGSYTGIRVVKRLIDRFNRPSIVVFILAVIMGLVVLLVPTYGIINLMHDYQNGSVNLGFKDFCAK